MLLRWAIIFAVILFIIAQVILLLISEPQSPSLRQMSDMTHHQVVIKTLNITDIRMERDAFSKEHTELTALPPQMTMTNSEGDPQLQPTPQPTTQSALPHVNPHPFHWEIVEKQLCNDDRKDLFVLAVIHSAPANIQQRMHIRETWGSLRLYEKTKTVLVFALGSTNATLQASIIRESQSYHDIIQEDFLDTYKNLTYKTIMWLKFANECCAEAKFVLKVDDDVFVNIFNVVSLLSQMVLSNSYGSLAIFCSVNYRNVPNRDPREKWYLTKEEYANETFPPYCSGAAYIITGELVQPLYEQSFKTKFIWVDDWYITGAVMAALHVIPTNIRSLYVFEKAMSIPAMRKQLVNGNMLFGHGANISERSVMWKNLFEQKGIDTA